MTKALQINYILFQSCYCFVHFGHESVGNRDSGADSDNDEASNSASKVSGTRKDRASDTIHETRISTITSYFQTTPKSKKLRISTRAVRVPGFRVPDSRIPEGFSGNPGTDRIPEFLSGNPGFAAD